MSAVCAITGEVFSSHHLAAHTESRDRLALIGHFIPRQVVRHPPSRGTIDDLRLVHDAEYVDRIAAVSSSGSEISFLTPDTYLAPGSFETARYATGSSIEAARRARSGEHAFALVRPPGHHATKNRAMGYCIFNNAAVAAARLLEDGCNRIAILDWDLHHGNGTQEIFYDSDRVLFCSVHLRGAFPGSGWVDEIGVGEGRGLNMNAPLKEGARLADITYVLEEAFVPAIINFDPDLLIVSAGQDGLADDPKAGMALEPNDYGVLAKIAADTVEKPIALILEGGYGPSQGEAVRAIFLALLGEQVYPPATKPRPSTMSVVRALRLLTG